MSKYLTLYLFDAVMCVFVCTDSQGIVCVGIASAMI